MHVMSLSQAAAVLNAQVEGSKDMLFTGVSSDSRNIKRGDLFVALRGERFDGYQFVQQALEAGAVASLVNAGSYGTYPALARSGGAVIVVEDTRLALGQLAAHWRRRFDIPLVAITGSNGKTTVKEMIACILREAAGNPEAVLATVGNLNNDIGMPLMLLKLTSTHRYAVLEMGMNHSGEIDYLTRIAAPDVAVINNAGSAHLEGLGSVRAVAEAKGEVFAGLKPNGTAVINADDEFAGLWRELAGANQLLEFGLGMQADVSCRWQPHGYGMQLEVTVPQGTFLVNLQIPGIHNVSNALAATATSIALNVPLEKIAAGLEKFRGVGGRLERKQARCGASLIDDTYNANPDSMRAAIRVLSGMAGKRLLVLGDMGELGSSASALHAEIGKEARQAGIDKLLAVGELSIHAVREFGSGAEHFDQIEDLEEALAKELDSGTTVLVKGSRFMKMERVVDFLTAGVALKPNAHGGTA
jgi:UDP-N-acetylmuramoyl-tripeptide--D-alanyl-D-alanine ligase